MKFLSFLLIFVFYFTSSISKEIDDIFFVGKMESYNQKFTLYFKTREKAILARGKNFNYITDYPQDLYIYNHFTKEIAIKIPPFAVPSNFVMIKPVKGIILLNSSN